MRKIQRHQEKAAGFGFLELLGAMAVLTATILALLAIIGPALVQSKQRANRIQVDVFRRNLIALAMDNGSWAKTVNIGKASGSRPAQMDCLTNGNPCTVDGLASGQPIQNVPFSIADGVGTIFYDGRQPSTGIKLDGTTCNTYGSDAECVLRYELIWSAHCSAGNCSNPQVKISAKLILHPSISSQSHFNPQNYSVPDIYRSSL